MASEVELSEPSLWVIEAALAARIIAATRADNERLLAMMDEATAAAVRADPAWWDPAHYASRTVSPPDAQPVDTEALERLTVALAEALVRVRRREAKLLRLDNASDDADADANDDEVDD